MSVMDTRLVDSRDVRFGRLPLRIALQKARAGWRVRVWNEGLDGWDEHWRPTYRLAARLHALFVGEAVLEVYVLDRPREYPVTNDRRAGR